jgi:tetratricopeptide (TPR) repeat protein
LYNLAISLGVAIVLSFLLRSVGVFDWIAFPLGLVAGVGVFIYLARKINEKIEAIFKMAFDQLKRQHWEPAIDTMKKGYQYSRWQLMIKSSIDGQIGTIQYWRNKHAEAEPLLKSANMKHYIAKTMLAVLQWKKGHKSLAKDTLDMALRAGKKESVLYGVYAYLLNEMHEKDAAIEMLNRGLKFCKDDERLLSNRTLLQNKKPMKMKVYGEQWYQFMLERPIIKQAPPPFARMPKRMARG